VQQFYYVINIQQGKYTTCIINGTKLQHPLVLHSELPVY